MCLSICQPPCILKSVPRFPEVPLQDRPVLYPLILTASLRNAIIYPKTGNDISFSEVGQQELDAIIQATSYATETVNTAFQRTDAAYARRVQPLSDVIEHMKDHIKAHHVERLQEGICSVQSGVVLLDLVNCFERIASHAANVALHVMKRASADQNFDEMHGHSSDAATEEYQALYTYYESGSVKKSL